MQCSGPMDKDIPCKCLSVCCVYGDLLVFVLPSNLLNALSVADVFVQVMVVSKGL